MMTLLTWKLGTLQKKTENTLEEVRACRIADEQAQQQLQAFLAPALLCTKDRREARPNMVDAITAYVRGKMSSSKRPIFRKKERDIESSYYKNLKELLEDF
ncbi:hypothetical protein DVH24_007770 [Malus domestica]|uniref:Uncharacterized protein n=1 Tax=Malus domestica TaxID=3750 RepID=A0A498JUD2_MALDO|nr:hypothetical protein DVH24_007770 [Malus domestica]